MKDKIPYSYNPKYPIRTSDMILDVASICNQITYYFQTANVIVLITCDNEIHNRQNINFKQNIVHKSNFL